MIRRAALISLFAAVLSTPAVAQTPAPQPGLAVSDVSTWLTSIGGQVSEVRREGDQAFFTVQDGPLTWALSFYGCAADICQDVQYSAVFANPAATPEAVNAWNTEQRFLKAFYMPDEAGGAPAIAVQYDVLLLPGGVDQLTDPTVVWTTMLPQFATRVGGMKAAPAAEPPTP